MYVDNNSISTPGINLTDIIVSTNEDLESTGEWLTANKLSVNVVRLNNWIWPGYQIFIIACDIQIKLHIR